MMDLVVYMTKDWEEFVLCFLADLLAFLAAFSFNYEGEEEDC